MKRALFVLSLASFAMTVAAHEPENEALLQVVQLPDVSHRPLKDVLRSITEQANLRLAFDLDAIDRAHVSLEAPVSANIRSLAAGKALDLVLEPCGLMYGATGKMIIVTAHRDSVQVWKQVSYPVDDLVNEIGMTPIANPDFAPLIDLIKSTVAPGTWNPDGRGKIRKSDDNRHLVIEQCEGAHNGIAELLMQLRWTAQSAPKISARKVVTLNFNDAPLSEVLAEISNQCQMNVLVAPGCGDPRVRIEIRTFTADEALAHLLPSLRLWRSYEHGALIVTPDRECYAVVYPIDPPKGGSPQAALEEISQTITARVLPESWKQPAGEGTGPSIETFVTNRTLVVSQTRRGHELVEQFLNQLGIATK